MVHAFRLESSISGNSSSISCVATSSNLLSSSRQNPHATLLWVAYRDGSVFVFLAGGAAASSSSGGTPPLHHEQPTEEDARPVMFARSTSSDPFSLDADHAGGDRAHANRFAVQLHPLSSHADSATRMLVVDSDGGLWTLTLVAEPPSARRLAYAVEAERLRDPAASGFVITCASVVQHRGGRASTIVCGCRGGSVLEWQACGDTWEMSHHVIAPDEITSGRHPSGDVTALSAAPMVDTTPADGAYAVAVGYDNGRVVMLHVDDSRCGALWFSVVFPGTWGAPASEVTALHFADGTDRPCAVLWCGGSNGCVEALDATNGETLKGETQQPHVVAHSGRVTGFVTSFDDGQVVVWSGGLDGLSISWSRPENATTQPFEVQRRFLHPDPVVGVAAVGGVGHPHVWSVGMHGIVHGLVPGRTRSYHHHRVDDNQLMSSPSDETCEKLNAMLDETMADLRVSQEDRAHLQDVNHRMRIDAARFLSDAEQHERASMHTSWADSLELLLVQFMVASKLLRRISAESQALVGERDYFRSLLATSSRTHAERSPPKKEAIRSSVGVKSSATGTSPLGPVTQIVQDPATNQRHASQIFERDAQISQLQNELLRLRCETDHQLEVAQQGYHRELQALRNISQDQRKAIDNLKDDLAVKSSVLEDTRKELREAKDSLQRAEKEHQTAFDNAIKAAEASAAATKRSITADLLAAHVELQEAQLCLQQQQKQHDAERRRLQDDMIAMKAPWEAMKKALHDTQSELEIVRAQYRRERKEEQKLEEAGGGSAWHYAPRPTHSYDSHNDYYATDSTTRRAEVGPQRRSAFDDDDNLDVETTSFRTTTTNLFKQPGEGTQRGRPSKDIPGQPTASSSPSSSRRQWQR